MACSAYTFSSPRSRNCRNPRPCLIWPNTGVRKAWTLPTPTDEAQMAGYATSGRGWHNPAVAGLLTARRTGPRPGIKLVDCLCRVIASIGGYFPGDCTDVVDGLLNHRRSLLLRPSPPRSPGERCPPPPDMYACRKSFPPGAGMTRLGEVTLGLVVGHTRVLTTFVLACSACASASSAAMASRIFSNRSRRPTPPATRNCRSSSSCLGRNNSATSAANCAAFSFIRW